jgi:ferredoxin
MAGEPQQSIRIDRIRCDGFGMCAELLPELVELDDWGYPIVRIGVVPGDLLPLARRAVDVCPVLAFRLGVETGGQIGAQAAKLPSAFGA